MFRPY